MKENSEPIIKLTDLTRDFGTFRAVDKLSIEVPPGIVFGFLGPNGAGKTTTIRILIGLMDATSGDASVLGFEPRTQGNEIRTRTGALLEHSGVYEHLNAEDNLEFFGRVYHIEKSARKARIRDLLTQMGLWDRRTEPVGKWSCGMKQRLALARAILHKPPLVFLDEPTAGLDVIAANVVRDDLTTLVKNEGTTVFLTSHNMAEAEKLCAQVAVINAGSLVTVGKPESLINHSNRPRLKIRGSGFNANIVAQLRVHPSVEQAEMNNGHLEITMMKEGHSSDLVNHLVNAGVRVEEVQHMRASLEDVFIRLMEDEG